MMFMVQSLFTIQLHLIIHSIILVFPSISNRSTRGQYEEDRSSVIDKVTENTDGSQSSGDCQINDSNDTSF